MQTEISELEAPYPNASMAWFAVVCLMLAYVVALIDRQIIALLNKPIRADFGLTDTQFSLLVGFAFVLFYSTMGLFGGRLADTVNRRNMIVVGMVLWSIATFCCGLASNFTELFLARMMVGVGEAVLSPAAYSMIADYFPKEKRAKAAATYSMAISLGYGGALLFGGAAVAAFSKSETTIVPLLGQVRSWQAIMFIVAIPGPLVAALMLTVKEPMRRELNKKASRFADAVTFIRGHAGTLSMVILAFALNGLITYCMSSWTTENFRRNFGWSAAEIASVQGTIMMTVGTLGIFAGGWWVSRADAAVSNITVLRASRNALLSIPIFALLVGFAPEIWMRFFGVAGIALLGGVPSGLAAVAIFHMTPNQFRGQITALYLMTGTLAGSGVGTTLVPAISDYIFRNEMAIGKSQGLVVAAAALTSSLLLHLAMKRPDKDFA